MGALLVPELLRHGCTDQDDAQRIARICYLCIFEPINLPELRVWSYLLEVVDIILWQPILEQIILYVGHHHLAYISDFITNIATFCSKIPDIQKREPAKKQLISVLPQTRHDLIDLVRAAFGEVVSTPRSIEAPLSVVTALTAEKITKILDSIAAPLSDGSYLRFQITLTSGLQMDLSRIIHSILLPTVRDSQGVHISRSGVPDPHRSAAKEQRHERLRKLLHNENLEDHDAIVLKHQDLTQEFFSELVMQIRDKLENHSLWLPGDLKDQIQGVFMSRLPEGSAAPQFLW